MEGSECLPPFKVTEKNKTGELISLDKEKAHKWNNPFGFVRGWMSISVSHVVPQEPKVVQLDMN